jgi:hypothetical protein
MNAQNNRQNHDFQIVYFLAGSCHTADGAYSLLCDLKESREMALQSSRVARLREESKRIGIARRTKDEDEIVRLEAEADLLELDQNVELTQRLIAAAEAELATIVGCLEALEPRRKFSHLSLPEAHEAAQYEEWKLELLHRAENQLLTAGGITPDLLGTLRMHPAFISDILPKLPLNADVKLHLSVQLDTPKRFLQLSGLVD